MPRGRGCGERRGLTLSRPRAGGQDAGARAPSPTPKEPADGSSAASPDPCACVLGERVAGVTGIRPPCRILVLPPSALDPSGLLGVCWLRSTALLVSLGPASQPPFRRQCWGSGDSRSPPASDNLSPKEAGFGLQTFSIISQTVNSFALWATWWLSQRLHCAIVT